MIAALILYLNVIAALFVIAAHTAERALRLLRKSGRGPWVAGMLLMCLAPLAVPYLTRDRATTTSAMLTGGDRAEQQAGAAPSTDGVRGIIPKNLTVAGDGTLTRFDRPLLVVWIAGSIACALFLIGSALRLAMTARSWRPGVVDGIPVLISHDTGPALIGAVLPRIVLPEWVLDLSLEQRALLLAHEREHARSYDPLLLLAAGWVVIAMPWNPSAWYALRRLRLAVESDCDRRVLRISPDVHTYGSLLLDVSERMVASAAPVAALAEPTSDLRRRISLMNPPRMRHVRLRVLGAAAVSVMATTLASQTPRPASTPVPSPRIDGNSGILRNHVVHEVTIGPGLESVFPDSILRRAVVTFFPSALTGEMGPHPFLWFLVDSNHKVVRTATGRDGLSRWSYPYLHDSMPSFLLNLSPGSRAEVEAHGIEYLGEQAARRRFPELRGISGDRLTYIMTSVKDTPVDVAWVQVGAPSSRRGDSLVRPVTPHKSAMNGRTIFTDSAIYRAQCKQADTIAKLTPIPRTCTLRDQRVEVR
jgi:beta-lactamase regulating signal transducer with metallopeptidase domain